MGKNRNFNAGCHKLVESFDAQYPDWDNSAKWVEVSRTDKTIKWRRAGKDGAYYEAETLIGPDAGYNEA